MKITVYDQSFNANEWFVIINLVVGFFLVLVLPKRFSSKETILYLLYGMFSGKFFDHTISIRPFDFYDVNDTSAFQLIDFASYVMFGPFAYIFIYLYDFLHVKRWKIFFYIVIWAIIAIAVEYVATKLGVYHYKNGYHLYFGFPIYLFTQSILIMIYYHIRNKPNKSLTNKG